MQDALTVTIPVDSIMDARKMYAEYASATIDVEGIKSSNSLRRLFPEGVPKGFMLEIQPDGAYTIRLDIVRRLLDVLGLSCLIVDKETGIIDDLVAEAMRRG